MGATVQTRVGWIEESLSLILERYSSKFERLPGVGRSDVEKYLRIITEKSKIYHIMASRNNHPCAKVYGYNVLITIGGPERTRVREILQEFENGTRIKLQTPPPQARQEMETTRVLLEEILRKGM